MTINVLCIAPVVRDLPPLALLDEISQIANIDGADVQILAGSEASRNHIAKALRQPRDVVVWAGHGMADRLVCSDGAYINARWLATQARAGAPRAFVVAACFSAQAGDSLESFTAELSDAGINAVGMFAEVDDAAAIVYDVEFVRALVAGANVSKAHRVALAEMAFVSPRSAHGAIYTPADSNGYRDYKDQLKSFELRLSGVEATLQELVIKAC